ncbi:helix-turn-helix transcriptional regulator [Caldicellulosiruptor acetigenus]|uniref:helix-turn-helix transcriptional regulator n=1 Tax=Caldicellulosiruptor acetigenus TaxID=301953 RepID=UPI000407CABB|nr:helix-turn-helix transcriptional regulator [Caldicellulosiruptor acetigenus]WAM35593.1 helix-turn-helix transcriptional regulator [Caldicellulosiruptor acetigenus]
MSYIAELENLFNSTQETEDFDSIEIQEFPQPMPKDVYRGVGGAVVNYLKDFTEAAPEALLINFLVAFGNMVGRRAWLEVGGDRHYPNLFAVLVGDTASGRKGSSWSIIERVFEKVDQSYILNNVRNGTVSGEGIIYHVRDPIFKWDKNSETYEMIDPGVEDKRLLIIESEFASLLRVMKREGNTLSPLLRNAWDGKAKLETLSKTNYARATNAHISLIGHITFDELKKELSDVEKMNGFGNRFLWLCVRRSKLLPNPPQIPEDKLTGLGLWIKDMVAKAPEGPISKTDAAKEVWALIYEKYADKGEGETAALIGRAEAQILRLSLIYALMDGSDRITPEHICTARLVWDYCQKSVEFIFSEFNREKESSMVLNLLTALKDKPLSQSEIAINVFKGHITANKLVKLLKKLNAQGLIEAKKEKTAGRPKTLWSLTDAGAKKLQSIA